MNEVITCLGNCNELLEGIVFDQSIIFILAVSKGEGSGFKNGSFKKAVDKGKNFENVLIDFV